MQYIGTEQQYHCNMHVLQTLRLNIYYDWRRLTTTIIITAVITTIIIMIVKITTTTIAMINHTTYAHNFGCDCTYADYSYC